MRSQAETGTEERRGGDSNSRALTSCRFSRPVTQIHNEHTAQDVTETGGRVLPSCLPESAEIDPELSRLIEAWPTLPEAIRRAIQALIGASVE